ncbi:hypothetical protein D3C75_714160 [compost metagenome]
MLHDFTYFFIVARQIDNIWTSCFDPGQNRFEIGVFLLIGFLAQNFSAVSLEGFFKELLQTLGVVTRSICIDYCRFSTEIVACKVSHNLALERIDKGCAEYPFVHIAAALVNCNLRVSCTNSYKWNLLLGSNRNDPQRVRRSGCTDNRNHFIIGDQLLRCLSCLFRFRGIVGNNQLKLLAQNTAGCIDLVYSELSTL